MDEDIFNIFPFYEAFYMESMLSITESALRSVNATNESLKPLAASGEINRFHILNSLQNIVVQGAALSRYFWPVRKKYAKRGEILRKAFGVAEESSLKSRELRNAIEHFDEKLDDYLAHGINGIILPDYIGSFAEKDNNSSHLFRAYYTDKAIFEILGKHFQVDPIVKEIARIHKLLEAACNSNGRFPEENGKPVA